MKMESIDITQKNIEIIEKYFPNCITEGEQKFGGGIARLLILNC